MRRIFFFPTVVAVLSLLRQGKAQTTIADVASENEELSTLVEWVGAAGLLGSINGTSDVTVFAPTNDGFEDVIERDLLRNLETPEWNAHLTDLLQSHMVEEVIPSSDLDAPKNITMVSGQVVALEIEPFITLDSVRLIEVDLEADNGVVHVLDGIISPAWLEQTLPEAAAGVDSVSTLVTLLEQAELDEDLSARGPFTVFAPSDKAFDDLGDAVTECITMDPEILSATLSYHVLEGMIPASGVTTGSVETFEGSDLSIDATTLKLNDEAGIISTDAALANNGIVHVIDKVLVPPSFRDPLDTCVASKLTLPERAAQLDDFSTLVDLLDRAGLDTTLDGEGPFTVFAPTNDAFAALAPDVEACVIGDKDILMDVLLYHVLPGSVFAGDLVTGNATTVESSMLDIDAEALTINNTTSITAIDEVEASNGILHAIDAVLVPPTVAEKLDACLAAEKVPESPIVDTSSSRGWVTAVSAALVMSVFSAL